MSRTNYELAQEIITRSRDALIPEHALHGYGKKMLEEMWMQIRTNYDADLEYGKFVEPVLKAYDEALGIMGCNMKDVVGGPEEEMTTNAQDIERDGIMWGRYKCPGCNIDFAFVKGCKDYNFCPKCGREVTLNYGRDNG